MTRRAEDLWRTWTHRPRVRSVARLPARAPRPGTPRGRRGTNTNRLAHAAPRRRAQEQTHSPASTVRTQPAQGLARALDVHHPTRGQTDQQPAEPALRGPVTFVQRLCRCGCPRAGCTCGIAHEQAPRRLRRGRAACPAQARLSLPLSSPWARAVRLRISVDPPARDRRRPPTGACASRAAALLEVGIDTAATLTPSHRGGRSSILRSHETYRTKEPTFYQISGRAAPKERVAFAGSCSMARPGLEPGTPRFSVVCSTS